MSLETWKAEFYPITADELKESFSTGPLTPEQDIILVNHAILKWQGLLPTNLEKHGIRKIGYAIISDGHSQLSIGESNCSLCRVYFEHIIWNCRGCPLYHHLGRPCYGENSPYIQFTYGDDPIHMLNALRGTKRMLLEECKRANNPCRNDAPTEMS